MAFSDTIESDLRTTVYVTRAGTGQDANGNYVSGVTTVTSGLVGDVQPASRWSYRSSEQGADYRITHVGFFDVPSTVPTEGDTVVDGSTQYAIRNTRDFKDHLELDMERLGL
jgi:hypothetical protein